MLIARLGTPASCSSVSSEAASTFSELVHTSLGGTSHLVKRVRIPGLGTFCLFKHYLSMEGHKFLHAQKPVFQLLENFARVHGLQYEKAALPGASTTVLLNYASVCLDTRVPRDTVQRCVQETLLFLSYTLAKKQDVDFIFKDIGCLRFRKNKVKMRFSADFVCSLDSTGLLLKSLCSRPGTTGSNVSGRRNAPSQTAAGDVVVFPNLGEKTYLCEECERCWHYKHMDTGETVVHQQRDKILFLVLKAT